MRMRILMNLSGLLFALCNGLCMLGQHTLYWDMQQALPTGLVSTLQVSSLSPGNNFGNTTFFTSLSASQQYTGASGGNNAGLACRTGGLSTGAAGSAFLGVTLTPANGYRLRILSVAFGSRSTLSGPARWGLFVSTDQFASAVHSSIVSANSVWSWQQSGALHIQSASSIELRLYGYEGTGTAAINVCNWRLDDLTIQYQIEAISLPVRWLYVKHSIRSRGVLLQWATTEEINNKEFQIERSDNGMHFQMIGVVASASAGDPQPLTRHYSFFDQDITVTKSCYRVKQVDVDGKESYSDIVFVSKPKGPSPPCIENLHFDPMTGLARAMIGHADASMQLQLHNARGQLIKTFNSGAFDVSLSADVAVEITTNQLPLGIYYLSIISRWGRSPARAILVR